MVFEALVDSIPSVSGLSGRPRCRPDKLHADKGDDFARCRQHLPKRGIVARIARWGVEKSDHLGKHRWGVERTRAWLAGFGKLRIRFERSLQTHLALRALLSGLGSSIRFVSRTYAPTDSIGKWAIAHGSAREDEPMLTIRCQRGRRNAELLLGAGAGL